MQFTVSRSAELQRLKPRPFSTELVSPRNFRAAAELNVFNQNELVSGCGSSLDRSSLKDGTVCSLWRELGSNDIYKAYGMCIYARHPVCQCCCITRPKEMHRSRRFCILTFSTPNIIPLHIMCAYSQSGVFALQWATAAGSVDEL